jgi:hypothetical protein
VLTDTEREIADLDFLVGRDRLALDTPALDVDAVPAAEILDDPPCKGIPEQPGVVARNPLAVEENVAVTVPADYGAGRPEFHAPGPRRARERQRCL